jgi:serine/threonine protein kinase
MPFVPSTGAEPISGYQLVEKLGVGGYGAVWKSTAPGGLTKAIKIVFGDVGSHQAEQELKALQRIKEVRHPFLLSLERFEILNGQLFIVTELADKSLLDRFEECRQAGLRGIPRTELLAYLRDAGEALDYMGETYGLQHLDIKPQNLLLVGGRIKVADFGLVKDLVGTSVTATGGVTPIYATPEAFDGRVSRHSDQYSLAVVYQEMLTGVRPFPGTTVLQLAAQHMSSRPLLDPLPPQDRPVIARALSKNPESRFPTCREMMEQLLRVRDPASPPTPRLDETPRPAPDKHNLRETIRVRRPRDRDVEDLAAVQPQDGSTPLPFEPLRHGPSAHGISPPGQENSTALRPTLFLGIGGLACSTLKRLRRRLHQRFGKLSAVPIFRFLLLDTDRAQLRTAQQGEPGEALDAQETLLAPLRPTEQYRDQSKAILRWLDRRWLYGIPRSLQTEGRRPLGSLALVDNSAAILARIRECLSQITDPDAKAGTTAKTGLRLRDDTPRIFIVASIAGATGGGMLAGIAYAVRQVLEEMRITAEGLSGILLQATSQKPGERDVALINAYATLNELYHYSLPDHSYPGNPECGLAPFAADHPPFQDAYLVQLGEQLSQAEVEAATDAVADYLCLDAATAGGAFLDQYRYSTHPANCERGANPTLRSFGLSRVSFPRQQLEKLATNLFCHNLIETWSGGLADQQVDLMQVEAQRQVDVLGLQADALIAHLRDSAETVLGEDLETCFGKLAAQASSGSSNSAVPTAGVPSSSQMLSPIDVVLGAGDDLADGSTSWATAFEKGLHEQGLQQGNQLGRSLVTWLLEILEDPDKRLKAADNASAWVVQHLRAETDSVRTKLAQMQSYRTQLRRQLAGKSSAKGSGVRWLPANLRPAVTGKSNGKLLEYCWARLGEVVLESAQTLLGAAYQCVNLFTEDLVLCRQRLAQFSALFPSHSATATPTDRGQIAAASLVELLPGRVDSLATAAERIVQYLPRNLFRNFAEHFQAEMLEQQPGFESIVAGSGPPESPGPQRVPSLAFWDTVSRNSDLAASLKERLQARVRPLILEALKDTNVADLFLESQPDGEQREQALATLLEQAQPRPRVPGGWQHLVLALPEGSAAGSLRDAITRQVSDVPSTVLRSDDEIVVLVEAAQLPLQQLADMLIGNERERMEMAHKVMTRVDVPWSLFAAVEA